MGRSSRGSRIKYEFLKRYPGHSGAEYMIFEQGFRAGAEAPLLFKTIFLVKALESIPSARGEIKKGQTFTVPKSLLVALEDRVEVVGFGPLHLEGGA